MAIAFETGDSLLEVAGIRVAMSTQGVGLETFVWIYSDNGSNRPGTELHQLTTVTLSGEDRSTVRGFVANNVTLSPRTKYWLVIGKTPANVQIAATTTETGRIDGGGAAYWDIGNLSLVWLRGQWVPVLNEDDVFAIQVWHLPTAQQYAAGLEQR